MKKIITMAMSLLMAVFMVITFSACSNKNEENVTESKTFNYEVQSIENLDVEKAKYQLIEKCKESHIISQEIATLRKAEYTEKGKISPIYISHKGNDVSISNEERSWKSCTTICEPGMYSVSVQKEPEYFRILMKKTKDSDPVEIILNGTEETAYFHSFKIWDKNLYIQNGSDLYVLDKENVELILIAEDFSKYVVYNDKDGQYYYLNTSNQWVNTAGEVIEEGVFGIEANGCSNYKTVLYV